VTEEAAAKAETMDEIRMFFEIVSDED